MIRSSRYSGRTLRCYGCDVVAGELQEGLCADCHESRCAKCGAQDRPLRDHRLIGGAALGLEGVTKLCSPCAVENAGAYEAA